MRDNSLLWCGVALAVAGAWAQVASAVKGGGHTTPHQTPHPELSSNNFSITNNVTMSQDLLLLSSAGAAKGTLQTLASGRSATYRCPVSSPCFVRFKGPTGNQTVQVSYRHAYILEWRGKRFALWDVSGS